MSADITQLPVVEQLPVEEPTPEATEAAAEGAQLDQSEPEPQPVEGQPEGVPAIAQVVLTMLADGGIHLQTAGEFKPGVAWGMGQFLTAVGDDLFRTATEARRQQLAAVDPKQRIVLPGGRRVPR